VVYLMGLLSAEEADRVAREAAEVNKAERVVKLFEIIAGPATSQPSD
jgi:osmotically-inducible protein OsmY